MPPEPRLVPRFAAEPPQESLPYGRWETRLHEALLAAVADLEDPPAELGELGEVVWYPDRSWHGRTYVPATSMTTGGYEIFGYVRMLSSEDGEPSALEAHADFTDETASENPDWQIDVLRGDDRALAGGERCGRKHDAGMGPPAGPRRRNRHGGAGGSGG